MTQDQRAQALTERRWTALTADTRRKIDAAVHRLEARAAQTWTATTTPWKAVTA